MKMRSFEKEEDYRYSEEYLKLILNNTLNTPFAKPRKKIEKEKILTIHSFLPLISVNVGLIPEPPTQTKQIFIYPPFYGLMVVYQIWSTITRKPKLKAIQRLQQIHLWEGIH